ncbi:hypothetical protein [Streptomyces sp. NPDC007264]|uniref:hypothetical protein n=1 Tax=Streptomyces sp. NPDC007264 TaxID=3364777 RepID=UPI0036D9F191
MGAGRPRTAPAALLVLLLVLAPFASGTSSAHARSAGDVPRAGDAPARGGCDPIAAAPCLLPFPNDWYTRADPTTPTGRRVAFQAEAMPANQDGERADPTAWNRADGFSPGSALLALVPGLDLESTGAAPITDIGRSLDDDAPIVIVDTATGKRWPYWAELDANARSADRQALIVHPARNFTEGHRYAVALRGLKDSAGRPLPVPAVFARLSGPGLPHDDPLHARQRALKAVLKDLRHAGVGSVGLDLAWDFTVASAKSLTGDLLAIRDDAFRQLGGAAPAYTITQVKDFTQEQDPRTAREVNGEVTVPSYLNAPGGPPGSLFNRAADGTPSRLPGNVQKAAFRCEIPRSALDRPSRPALYGHGLFGSRSEVGAGNVKAMANEHDITFCATDWIGMAGEDVPTAVAAMLDLGHFPALPERTQQGMLNALFVGRALVHSRGFTDDPAFRSADGKPLLDAAQGLVYDGNSQGGILGGALVAASPDIRRGVLGVTGMNYSLLLNRSADFGLFQAVLDLTYPDKVDQQLYLGLAQMVWDHGETNGYAGHLTRDPLPGTPRHQVLMHIAYGDHQVANIAAEVEARTLGARLVTPALATGRSPDRVPYWGIRPAGNLPYRGSAMVVWDSGTPSPPTTNTPPTEPAYGHDPHSDPRNSPAARRQKAAFLDSGQVIDVCGSAPCTAAPTS